MAIKIVDKEPDVEITRTEHDKLLAEYQRVFWSGTETRTFEDFVRSQTSKKLLEG